MDWSLLHTLNDFLFRHDQVEDPLLFYINASEMLFVATLAVVFLLAHGRRHLDWRRATVAAVLSAGLGLAVAKVLSELVDRARPFRRRRLSQRPRDGGVRDRDGDSPSQAAGRTRRPRCRGGALGRPGRDRRSLPQ
jgi:hypothetical protein